MLTVSQLKNASGYGKTHLEHSDYYDKDNTVKGQWIGEGALQLGLLGEIKEGECDKLLNGLDPIRGEQLRPRKSEISGYDVVLSAPKSVSTQYSLGQDDRLLEAHRASVEYVMKLSEHLIESRDQSQGKNEKYPTGNFICAQYEHDTSRELDPQLHTHNVIMNVTWDAKTKEWRSVSNFSELYAQSKYLTEVYRNDLEKRCNELGYETVGRFDSKGNWTFELKHISEKMCEHNSRRNQQKEAAIEEFRRVYKDEPTNNEVKVLVQKTRAASLREISTDEVKKEQREWNGEERVALCLEATEHAKANTKQLEYHPSEKFLEHGKKLCFTKHCVVKDYEVLRQALIDGRGKIDHQELLAEMGKQENEGTLLRAGRDITTEKMLALERQLLDLTKDGKLDYVKFAGEGNEVKAVPQVGRLSVEQADVVNKICGNRDFVVHLDGIAGSGKTTTLNEISRILEANGSELKTLAPSTKAVEVLKREGLKGAETVQMYLTNPKLQEELSGKHVVIDEASMLSTQDMVDVLTKLKENGCRVVLAGDEKQLNSVEAGDALRIMNKHGQMERYALTEIFRQKDDADKEIVKLLHSSTPMKGFDKLVERGKVQESPMYARPDVLANEVARIKNEQPGKSVMLVAPTHEEIDRLTEKIREKLIESGDLGKPVMVTVLKQRNLNEADLEKQRNFRVGDVVVFHRKTKEMPRGAEGEIISNDKHGVIIREADGHEARVTSKQAGCIGLYEKKQIELRPGDQLLCLSNDRKKGITNGDLREFKGLDEHGEIIFKGGQKAENYRHIDYGYVSTVHKVQGDSADISLVVGGPTNANLAFTALSRFKQDTMILTTSIDDFRSSLGVSGDRESATEMVGRGSTQSNEPDEQEANVNKQILDMIEIDLLRRRGELEKKARENQWQSITPAYPQDRQNEGREYAI